MYKSFVPDELRTIKTKLIWIFNLRQIILLFICVAIDFLVLTVLSATTGVSTDMLIYLIVLIDLPIMGFCVEPGGMTMESYIKQVLLRSLTAPKKRTYQCQELAQTQTHQTPQKELEKKLKKTDIIKLD